MAVRCPGHDRPAHILEGTLIGSRDGAFCSACTNARNRQRSEVRAMAAVRSRPLLYLDPEQSAPRPVKDPTLTLLAHTVARAANPERLLHLLDGRPDEALELAVSDEGCALFVGPQLLHRLPRKDLPDAA